MCVSDGCWEAPLMGSSKVRCMDTDLTSLNLDTWFPRCQTELVYSDPLEYQQCLMWTRNNIWHAALLPGSWWAIWGVNSLETIFICSSAMHNHMVAAEGPRENTLVLNWHAEQNRELSQHPQQERASKGAMPNPLEQRLLSCQMLGTLSCHQLSRLRWLSIRRSKCLQAQVQQSQLRGRWGD